MKMAQRTPPIIGHPYRARKDGDKTQHAVQQDDDIKEFYMQIVNESLEKAYLYKNPEKNIKKNKKKKTVIIVGAGIAGLTAAFELEKEGYKTKILELQSRVGGRTKTLRNGLADGLHAEGGAMRIPPNHYLTHGYINTFGIQLRPFVNYNPNAWICLEGQERITNEEWRNNNRNLSTAFFPGWDKNIPNGVPQVQGILDLHDRTMQPVKDDLSDLISQHGNQNGWEVWVGRWSKLSVLEFLRTNLGDTNAIYRPWPDIAIKGFELCTYNPTLDQSLVEYLRDELGHWWQDDLETPVEGMDTIAKHFIQQQAGVNGETIHLANNITFGIKVKSVQRQNDGTVEVIGHNKVTGNDMTFVGDAAILTVPLTILRQIDLDIGVNYRRAIRAVHYQASTKVVIQCKSRFWETELGQGGFTRTDMPIGQLHYPSPNDPPAPNGRGILVSYTWGQDALIFGSQSPESALDSAVSQISKFHPEIKTEFEVGMVQAWFSDESSQGAFVCLLPSQYNDAMQTLMTPDHPVYLAGEAVSFTHGWVHGAMESGLNAAYHLYCHDQEDLN